MLPGKSYGQTAANADIVDKTVSLGKALHLEVNEDVRELVEERSKDVTTVEKATESGKRQESAHQRRKTAI